MGEFRNASLAADSDFQSPSPPDGVTSEAAARIEIYQATVTKSLDAEMFDNLCPRLSFTY
jgi:hypothetical protein